MKLVFDSVVATTVIYDNDNNYASTCCLCYSIPTNCNSCKETFFFLVLRCCCCCCWTMILTFQTFVCLFVSYKILTNSYSSTVSKITANISNDTHGNIAIYAMIPFYIFVKFYVFVLFFFFSSPCNFQWKAKPISNNYTS